MSGFVDIKEDFHPRVYLRSPDGQMTRAEWPDPRLLALPRGCAIIIAVALRNEDVVAGIRAIASSPLVGVLEAAAEKMFPKVAPALRLAAIALAAFDPDTTKWIQNALNIDLKDELPAPLVVDGDYGLTRSLSPQLCWGD